MKQITKRLIQMAPYYYAIAILDYVMDSEHGEAGLEEITREYTEMRGVPRALN